MKLFFTTLVFVFTCVLQANSLQLRWTNPVHANEVVTLQWSDGVPPYTVSAYHYPNTLLASAQYQASGYDTWRVNVPQGSQIGFAVVDAQGVDYAAVSGWLVVQPDLALMSGGASAASASEATALESSTSDSSTNAQQPTALQQPTTMQQPTTTQQPTATQQPTSTQQPTAAQKPTVAATSPSSSQAPQSTVRVGLLVAGVLGGLAALLIFSLLTFWVMRRYKAAPGSAPALLPTVNPEYKLHKDKDTSTLASSTSLLPSVPYLPTPATPTLTPTPTHTTTPTHTPAPMYTPASTYTPVYGGLPEVQNARQ